MAPQKPPLFGHAIARQCTRWTGGRNCGKTPIKHVAWNIDGDGVDDGFVCADHIAELGTVYAYDQAHDVSDDCGMRGSYWYYDENVCRCEDDLSPAPAPEREAVAA